MTNEQTPLLALPYLMPSQAQKHVTHNEALRMLDALTHIRVETMGRDAPPDSPAEGERHLVGASPSGAFAGQAGKLAAFQDGAWAFFTPRPGWLLWDAGGGKLHAFDDGVWAEAAPDPEQLARLGIGTEADAVNRLAVAGEATLFTHDGAGAGGGHQMKLNKAASTDTASILFQTGWSGRAEIGLAGGDDFAVKVSGDGTAWKTVLRANPDGHAGIATEESRYRLTVGQPGAAGDIQAVHYGNTIGLAGSNAAYFYGHAVESNIRFLMGTSTAGYVLLASMSNHPFVIRVNNTIEAMRIANDGRIGIGTATPHASAQAEIAAPSAGPGRGFLPPRLTTPQRDAIAAPAEGLTIYNLTTHEPQFWNGSKWVGMAA